jgi:hypothetical protein
VPGWSPSSANLAASYHRNTIEISLKQLGDLLIALEQLYRSS